ncbi:MAG: hypothetical protein OGMRLDGQ_002419 [Candidatus Fervidibacter sp.]|jgi:hypothetical protein
MMNWKVLVFYLTLLLFLVTSGKTLWWLPLGSLVLLILTLPSKRITVAFDWHHWHPVFASLAAFPFGLIFSRWVRYKKIIGGDSLFPLPTCSEFGVLLLDLSKNDLDTFLHFIWTRNLLTHAWGQPKPHLLRLLEVTRKGSDRVDLSYLVGFLTSKEVEWHSAGCFGIGFFGEGTKKQSRILPTLGQTVWRVRRENAYWVFTTDGVAENIDRVIDELRAGKSLDEFIQTLPRQDDLTIGCFVSKLKALSKDKAVNLR